MRTPVLFLLVTVVFHLVPCYFTSLPCYFTSPVQFQLNSDFPIHFLMVNLGAIQLTYHRTMLQCRIKNNVQQLK